MRVIIFTYKNYCLVRKDLEKQFYNGKYCTYTQIYKMPENSIVIHITEFIH